MNFFTKIRKILKENIITTNGKVAFTKKFDTSQKKYITQKKKLTKKEQIYQLVFYFFSFI